MPLSFNSLIDIIFLIVGSDVFFYFFLILMPNKEFDGLINFIIAG